MLHLKAVVLTLVISYLVYSEGNLLCDSVIYCHGGVLDLVQRARIFNDSKTFVDMALRKSPDIVGEKFATFLNRTRYHPNKKQIFQFVEENFECQKELERWVLPDFNRKPKMLEKIVNPALSRFANDLLNIWTKLARKVKTDVRNNEDKHSLIPLPNGFIVPGGRFKEIYYWDSYWIVKGLLLSEMTGTARGIIENFIYLIERYGFVPNGSRVYYLNRSQPPLLTLMVGLYIEVTNDIPWLESIIDVLAEELNWWLTQRTLIIEKDGEKYKLAHYGTESKTPRSESYYEDTKTCSVYHSMEEKEDCYRNLKSAAESGWDFSSRWIFDKDAKSKANISRTQPLRLVPVDLNSYLCRAFKEMAKFNKLINDEENSVYWQGLAHSWENAIEKILYHVQDGIWYDYDTVSGQARNYFFPSNFSPLWAKAYPSEHRNQLGKRAAAYFESKDILRFKGGVPASLDRTGQQWDFPNAFPPLQEIVILGLRRTGNVQAENIARTLARRWVNIMMRSYDEEETLFEKYSAEHPGMYGEGGEYVVQTGFGWTIGVTLSLINEYFTSNITRIG